MTTGITSITSTRDHSTGKSISYGKLVFQVIAIPMVLGYRPGHEDASSTGSTPAIGIIQGGKLVSEGI